MHFRPHDDDDDDDDEMIMMMTMIILTYLECGNGVVSCCKMGRRLFFVRLCLQGGAVVKQELNLCSKSRERKL